MAKKSVAAKAVIARRKEAMVQMRPAMRRQAGKIEKMLAKVEGAALRYYYQIGQECAKVLEDPDTFGPTGMVLMEEVLSVHATTIRRCASFSKCDEEELEELIALHDEETNFGITFTHVIYLMALPSRTARRTWAKRAVHEVWTPKQLALEISNASGSSRASGQGPKHAMPNGLTAQLAQMFSVSRAWLAKQNTVWWRGGEDENVFGNIMKAPPAEYTASHLKHLRELRTTTEEMQEETAGNLTRIDQAIEQVEAALGETIADAA